MVCPSCKIHVNGQHRYRNGSPYIITSPTIRRKGSGAPNTDHLWRCRRCLGYLHTEGDTERFILGVGLGYQRQASSRYLAGQNSFDERVLLASTGKKRLPQIVT